MKNSLYITPKELAELLGVSIPTIRRWSSKGCPRVYIGQVTRGAGSRPRYNLQQVRTWLEARTLAAAGKGVQA